MEGGEVAPGEEEEGDREAADGDVGKPVGAGDKAGKGAEEGIEAGIAAQAPAGDEGVASSKEKEGGGMVAGEAGGRVVFDFEPEDFIRDAGAVGDDEGGAVAGDIEVFAEEHAVDEEDDAGGEDEEEHALRGAAEFFATGGGVDGENEEGDEDDVFNPIGEMVVDERPEDLRPVVAFEGAVEGFKNGEVDGIPERACNGPKKCSD